MDYGGGGEMRTDVLVLTYCELCKRNRAVQKCIVAGTEIWLCHECIKKIFLKFFPNDPAALFYKQVKEK